MGCCQSKKADLHEVVLGDANESPHCVPHIEIRQSFGANKSALTYDEGTLVARETSLCLVSDDLNSTRKDSRAGCDEKQSPDLKIGYTESQPANESEFQEATTPGIESVMGNAEQKQTTDDQAQPQDKDEDEDNNQVLRQKVMDLNVKQHGYFPEKSHEGRQCLIKVMSHALKKVTNNIRTNKKRKSTRNQQISTPTGEIESTERADVLYKLNDANVAYHVENSAGTIVQQVNCVDSIAISLKIKNMETDQTIEKAYYSGLQKMAINLEDNSVTYDRKTDTTPGDELRLRRSQQGGRARNEDCMKTLGFEFYLPRTAPDKFGVFGYHWSETFMPEVEKQKALPSMRNVIDGLREHHCNQIRDKMRGQPKDSVSKCLDDIHAAFDYFVECVGSDRVDEPLTVEILRDPYSAEVCMLLYLYSVEPPFYSDLYQACRSVDIFKVHTLGPFARALFELLKQCEYSERRRDDALLQGIKQGHEGPYGYFSQAFLAFRGANMPKQAVNEWQQYTNKSINMPGFTSMYRNFKTAIDFTTIQLQKQDQLTKQTTRIPVIFVILIQNYNGYDGFSINSKCHTAYPEEQEYLLREGFNVTVLKVEDQFVINNDTLSEYNNKQISVVYLYH